MDDAGGGAGAGAAGFERNRKRRTVEALLQSRGDEPDDAGMPVGGRHQHHRALLIVAERRHRFGFRLREHLLFQRLPLAVQPVEFGGDAPRLGRIVGQQKLRAEIGAADAPAGVDARTEHEAEMPWLRRTGQPCGIHQRGEPGVLAPPERDQPL